MVLLYMCCFLIQVCDIFCKANNDIDLNVKRHFTSPWGRFHKRICDIFCLANIQNQSQLKMVVNCGFIKGDSHTLVLVVILLNGPWMKTVR